ncbi:hypothetical protein CYMTET_13917 [Cymbomonas tetramitiformis]|uniref:Uncharacterized protein n=1 Tax=Cymbomonas tetramitiformis TaxID=36881 RepID=A0AAE0GH23_9CHLO|nr:hypothetical protein CYMTET_13917 [Cymbomonas tetramitiformis]
MASSRRSPRPVVESLRSARAAAAASGTPAGSALPGSAAPSPQRGSRTPSQDPDPVVRMSALISKPTFISLAATSADFHRDASVWASTPVRASQQYEYSERLDYAFTYGEELVKVLRSHGFKPQKGYTFDGPDSETDFAVLLGNLRHVLSLISHYEYDKLFDLEHEYLEYHWSLNELIFIILKGVLHGTALALYQESAQVHPRDGRCALQRLRYHVEATTDPDTFRLWTKLRDTKIDETADPAPQLTVLRVLGDKHQRLHPAYDDGGRVQDLQHVLISRSAASSPHVSPLYLVVLRELAAGHRFTFSTLALRIATVWQSEGHLSRLAPSPSSGAGGGKARADGAGGATFNSVHKRGGVVKPVGDWKPAQNPRIPYCTWRGRGSATLASHASAFGASPMATSPQRGCALTRAPRHLRLPGRHLMRRRLRSALPTVVAWARPAGGVPPATDPGPPTGRGSPSLQHAAVDDDGDDEPAAFPFRPLLDRDGPEPMPDTSVDDGGADWPALRSVPWIPPFQGASTSRSAAKQD